MTAPTVTFTFESSVTCLASLMHDLRGLAFGVSARIGHHGAHHQAVAVVAQRVTHVPQLAGGLALAVQLGIGIGLGLVRLVAALATLEVSAVVFVFIAAILAYKVLVACPRLNRKQSFNDAPQSCSVRRKIQRTAVGMFHGSSAV
ncbi:conserved hypothetical protein [Cupriavidus taiwanensis]|uniref:Uncharacterized protein n=1 Tax=Cupriavidus taiwanensis TaxID=164546 RepID=A0A375JFJ0_9BURK|nr:conserved hypothetical protein [Cupriavidus taiwanensis]